MFQHRRLGILLPTVAFVLLSYLPTFAAEEWPVPRGPARETIAFRYDPAMWKKVPAAFLDDAPACILQSSTTHIIEADGTVETISHEVTRLNGRKGIEKLGEYRNIVYDPSFQKLVLNEARVIKADGHVVAIEPKHVQLRDLSTDYQVYDHDKQLIVSFPNLEVGDVVEIKWTVRGKDPEHQGQFFTRYNFGDDTYPVVRDEFRVRLPKSRELKFAPIGGKLDPQIAEDGDWRTYHWFVTNRPRLPQDDSLPPKEEMRLQVAVSTFTSWEEIGKWKQKLRADCWECTADIKTLVQEITRDLKTPLEKARALTYWARRNIRYVSVGERHAYTPHAPAFVLSARYGDCKDQSQFLAVMLREAGIRVALATLGVLDDGQVLEAVPSPWGTHAILLVTIDGQEHWIDTTSSLASWDYLPRDDRDRLCYVFDAVGPEGKPSLRLVRTPPMKPEDNRIEQKTQVSVGADGSSRCKRSVAYYGNAALSQRDYWMEVPPGERRRLVTVELQDANSRTRLTGLSVSDKELRNFDKPVAADIVYEILGHFSGDSDREGSFTDSKVWSKLLTYNLDYDRQVAMDLWAPFESHHVYSVQLPPAYRLDTIPKDRNVTSKWGSFTLTVKADASEPRKVEIDFHTQLEKTRIDPADFDAYRKFQEEVTKYYRVWLTLKPANDLADATALEAVLALTPDDNTSALILARLYQQNNKPAEARRVLRRARHYRPNEAALWETAVNVAENLEEEESLYRELVKRFPDEQKYSVALGATLVKRGQFDKAQAVLEPVAEKGAAVQQGQAFLQLARNCFCQHQSAMALEHIEAAAKADPDCLNNVLALQFKARVQESVGQAKEAIDTYRQSLKIEADSLESTGALIRLSLAANDRDTALTYLRRFTVAVGHDPAGLATAADFHYQMGRLDDAGDLAVRALSAGPREEAERVIGLVHFQRGEYENALVHLEKAGNNDPSVIVGLISSHLALGNVSQAIEQVEQVKLKEPTATLAQACSLVVQIAQRQSAVAKTLHPPEGKVAAWKSAAGYLACAEYTHDAGLPSERAAPLLTKCFAENLECGPAYALRGQLALEKSQLTRALADAEQALKLSPEDPRAHYVRGRVRLERNTEGALADLTEAAKLSQRKDAAMLHWLASALGQASRLDEALATQREAVKIRPNDRTLLEQLREFEQMKKNERAGE